ncbi:hypothetical protein BIW11_01797 [Tropilaelaps mercedesae]|uniref:Uncharacterized protein n=1 Tax=Tropilaelaps mercedesae TaxID=418985 RepID=A0A1V9X8M5_9ACAR|nr:hypothetical protein BIW11_01797 [Tropilaelaps mercedesae]
MTWRARLLHFYLRQTSPRGPRGDTLGEGVYIFEVVRPAELLPRQTTRASHSTTKAMFSRSCWSRHTQTPAHIHAMKYISAFGCARARRSPRSEQQKCESHWTTSVRPQRANSAVGDCAARTTLSRPRDSAMVGSGREKLAGDCVVVQ